ncbi:ankyrin repeat domain-containing protein [Xanthomonas sp. WHRI 10064A]|uniref:ankyrin repeat domain-containing protein n=1 Tax=unclassified Xanthomonas TaxID=2643310 RepID=UPI002B232DC8|nr:MULTISPECIES: ankyrin repeat domain-containing protein [unclassified Xanthomonas]MEA9587655.1 ankyrin repeat domain-containing protein [Xanthomonas sp. WHRI 10064B]MEA9615377.1 ankyrin repeat domain-containing protein [Xanthomonas sp. WHRI 10064A]
MSILDIEKNYAALRELLAEGADPNAQNAQGDTPLHWAVRVHQSNTRDGQGDTPMHVAAKRLRRNTNATTVSALLAAGADPNLRNTAGVSVLYEAAIGGNLNQVKALLAAGAEMSDAERARFYEDGWKQSHVCDYLQQLEHSAERSQFLDYALPAAVKTSPARHRF